MDPHASDAAPAFGNGRLDISDLIQVLFAVTNVPGFRPTPCSDRFDAMDLHPADSGTARGGNGRLDILDLILELFRVTDLDGARPVRASLGGSCGVTQGIADAVSGLHESSQRLRPGADGSLAFGAPQPVGEGSERVPVYLDAARALNRVALTFGLGDGVSAMKFVAAGPPASLVYDSRPGVIAVAWAQGLSVQAGARLLLGYVEGPAGAPANWRVFGVSAAGLDDEREVRIGAPAAAGQE